MTQVGGQEEIRVPSGRVRLVTDFRSPPTRPSNSCSTGACARASSTRRASPVHSLKPAFRVIDVTEFAVLRGSVALNTIVATGDPNGCAADGADLASATTCTSSPAPT